MTTSLGMVFCFLFKFPYPMFGFFYFTVDIGCFMVCFGCCYFFSTRVGDISRGVIKIKNNQKYKNVFGIDVKALISATQNIQKMAWEQVLLLAIYSRQQYISHDVQGFKNRIQLVHEAKKYENVCDDVLKLLAEGKGSNEIVGMLLKDERMGRISLLQEIEKKGIAFASDNKAHPYSYYAMYTILRDPLSVFHPLLAFDNLSLSTYIVQTWQDINKSPFLIFETDNPLFNSNLSLDELTDLIEKRNNDEDTAAFQSEVKGRLAKDIGKHLKATFDQLIWPTQMNYEPVSLFKEMCTSIKDKHQFRMDFNADMLNNMINLGQIDSVMEAIKAEILEAYNKSSTVDLWGRQDHKHSAGVIDALSNWYKSVNTGLIKKMERVPRLVASLLDFDLRYEIGMGSEGFGLINMKNFNTKLTTRDYAKLVTGIIRHTLFNMGVSYDLQNSSLRRYQSIEDYFSGIPDVEENTSPELSLMKIWAEQEIGPMLERFKKLPCYLKPYSKIEFVNSKIQQQKCLSRDEANPYPINSLFPLPLWAKLTDKQ